MTVEPPPRTAVRAAWIAAAAAVVGFIPLHLVRALGILLFAVWVAALAVATASYARRTGSADRGERLHRAYPPEG